MEPIKLQKEAITQPEPASTPRDSISIRIGSDPYREFFYNYINIYHRGIENKMIEIMKKDKYDYHDLKEFAVNLGILILKGIFDHSDNNKMLREARKILTPEMFMDESQADTWKVICARQDEGLSIEQETIFFVMSKDLREKLVLETDYEKDRDNEYTFPSRCKALKELSYRLRVCDYATQLFADALATNLKTVKSLDSERVNFPAWMEDTDIRLVRITDAINQVAEEIESGTSSRVTTGDQTLDTLLNGGFAPGNLVVIAARPGVGKTSFMHQLARAADKAGFRSDIYSLEITTSETAQRFLISTGEVAPSFIYAARGKEDPEAWDSFEKAAARLDDCGVRVDQRSRTVEDICASITKEAADGKPGIVFIDYLGLLDSTSKSRNALQAQVLAEYTRKLKETAAVCKIPIVLLCQLNRDSAKDTRPPRLYDLRDSGAIEQDADIVMMLEGVIRDGKNTVDLWLRKNRCGKKNLRLEMEVDETYTSFRIKEVYTE